MSAMHFDDNGAAQNGIAIGDNGSAYGVKASVTERGLTAFGKYERALDTDDGANLVTGFGTATTGLATGGTDYVREAYAGLRCDALGAMLIGTAETAYSQASRRWDPFYNTGLGSLTGTVGTPLGIGIGPSHGGSILSLPIRRAGYANNQIAYTSPNFVGVTVNGAVFTDEDRGGASDPDYGLGAEFSGGGFSVGLQSLDLNSGTSVGSVAPNFLLTNIKALLGYAGFGTSKFGLGLTYERLDGPGIGTIPSADSLHATGWVGLTPYVRLAGSFGSTNEIVEGNSFALGVFYDVIQNFTTYVGGRIYDGKVSTGSPTNSDAYAVALGLSYKFDFGFAQH
jgi:predicted porin